jgi:hypothetical protein
MKTTHYIHYNKSTFSISLYWANRFYPCNHYRPRSVRTSVPSDHGLHSLLIHLLHILKFSLKMINGFAQIERWTSPFKIQLTLGNSKSKGLGILLREKRNSSNVELSPLRWQEVGLLLLLAAMLQYLTVEITLNHLQLRIINKKKYIIQNLIHVY